MSWHGWLITWACFLFLGSVVALARSNPDSGTLPDLPPWANGSKPFMLIIAGDITTAELVRACERAMQFWGEHVPGMWLNYGNAGLGATVSLMSCDTLHPPLRDRCGGFGHTQFTIQENHILSAAIYVDATLIGKMTELQLWRAIAHELGHVVGLAHDDLRRSVMYHKALDQQPTVTAQDRNLLQGIYR